MKKKLRAARLKQNLLVLIKLKSVTKEFIKKGSWLLLAVVYTTN